MDACVRKKGFGWEGAIKDGTAIVWSCGHTHHNRDHNGRFHGRSARKCAELYLRDPANWESNIKKEI